MSWSTSRPALAAVLAAATLALLLGAGCESMRDPDASDLQALREFAKALVH